MQRFVIRATPPGINQVYNSHSYHRITEVKNLWHNLTFIAAKNVKVKGPFSTILCAVCKRPRDADNLALCHKFICDQLVQAGQIPGDSPKYLLSVRLISRKILKHEDQSDKVIFCIIDHGGAHEGI